MPSMFPFAYFLAQVCEKSPRGSHFTVILLHVFVFLLGPTYHLYVWEELGVCKYEVGRRCKKIFRGNHTRARMKIRLGLNLSKWSRHAKSKSAFLNMRSGVVLSTFFGPFSFQCCIQNTKKYVPFIFSSRLSWYPNHGVEI